jgi:hypothetical protein
MSIAIRVGSPVPVSYHVDLSQASGLSLRYALLIRDGRYIPHPVHYPALAALVAA